MSDFWDENGKTLVAVLGGFALLAFASVMIRGCNRDEVQKECLRTGHTALECKELR